MAFMIKNDRTGYGTVDQWQRATTGRTTLPQTTTDQIFRVYGGKVLVKALVGTITTVIQGTDPVLKLTVLQLDSLNAAVGSAYDVASTLDLSSFAVGEFIYSELDGTAIVRATSTAAMIPATATSPGQYVAVLPPCEVYVTTGASKTGAIQWDIYWQPLDRAAYLIAVDTAAVAI